MNILEILPLINPQPNESCYKSIIGNLEEFFKDHGHYLDLNWDLYSKHPEFKNIQLYRLHHWRVDDHEGGTELYTYKGIPFGTWMSVHEDRYDYEVLDRNIFKQVLSILLECIEPEDEDEIQEYPILQIFDASYQVQGKNLVLLKDDETFDLIESYRKSTDEANDYFTKFYYVTVLGVETKVPYRHMFGVINDNANVAKAIVDGTLKMGSVLFHHNGLFNIKEEGNYD